MDLNTLLPSILGGGIVSSVITWFGEQKSKKAERRMNYLDRQLQTIYGPIYFRLSLSVKIQDLITKHEWDMDDVKAYYPAKNLEDAQKFLNDIKFTADVILKHIATIDSNNDEIKDLFYKYSDLLDPDDVDFSINFLESYFRFNIENKRLKSHKEILDIQKGPKIPDFIIKKIGESTSPSKLAIDQFKKKFLAKKNELEELQKTRGLKFVNFSFYLLIFIAVVYIIARKYNIFTYFT